MGILHPRSFHINRGPALLLNSFGAGGPVNCGENRLSQPRPTVSRYPGLFRGFNFVWLFVIWQITAL